MRHLFATRGAPGSGKSTWIKNNGLEPFTLSADSIRLLFQSPVFDVEGRKIICQKNDKRVWELLLNLVEERMERGELIVVDATHSKSADWAKYKKLAEKYRYRVHSVDFSDVSLETCLKQNKSRDSYKFVPEQAIENLWTRTQTQNPPNWVKEVKPDKISQVLDIFPLDFNHYENIYIFSDVHSSWEPLKEFLETYKPTEKDFVIFNGDWFDRNDQVKEILKFWVEWHNRSNFLSTVGNHDVHFAKWAYEEKDKIRSKEFIYGTMPLLEKAMEESGYDLGLMRNLVRKQARFAYFNYFGNNYFVCHGGIPTHKDLIFTSTQELIKGAGSYSEIGQVAESWIKNTLDTEIQIIGHRNMGCLASEDGRYPINFNDSNRVFLLEGGCEEGGHLRFVHLNRNEIKTIEIRNNHFRERKTIRGTTVNKNNEEILNILRSSKDIYESKQGHISSFNFKKDVFFKNTWNEINSFARGLFFNTNNDIVARFGVKCFNFEQVAETEERNLRKNLKWPVYNSLKVNGFLSLLGYDSVTDDLVFCSKSRVNGEFAENFERIFRAEHNDILPRLKDYLRESNLCLGFETIDPVNDPHIIKYEKEHVVLLDAYYRTVETKKVDYSLLKDIASSFGFSCKENAGEFDNWDDLKSFLESSKNKEIEGYMLEDASGFQFKYKTSFYSFWKRVRTIAGTLAKGQNYNTSSLTTPELNIVYAWLKKQNKNTLSLPVIEIREKFLNENKKI